MFDWFVSGSEDVCSNTTNGMVGSSMTAIDDDDDVDFDRVSDDSGWLGVVIVLVVDENRLVVSAVTAVVVVVVVVVVGLLILAGNGLSRSSRPSGTDNFANSSRN